SLYRRRIGNERDQPVRVVPVGRNRRSQPVVGVSLPDKLLCIDRLRTEILGALAEEVGVPFVLVWRTERSPVQVFERLVERRDDNQRRARRDRLKVLVSILAKAVV